MRADASWDGPLMISNGFLPAAAHRWMWSILALMVVTATRKAWLKLARFVGEASLRHIAGG